MSIEHLWPIATSIGFGGIAGFLIGFAIKKIMKILAVVAGVFFAALMYLESQEIVNINWDKLQTVSQGTMSTLTNAATTGQIGNLAIFPSATNFALPLTGSMAMGFAFGFMKG